MERQNGDKEGGWGGLRLDLELPGLKGPNLDPLESEQEPGQPPGRGEGGEFHEGGACGLPRHSKGGLRAKGCLGAEHEHEARLAEGGAGHEGGDELELGVDTGHALLHLERPHAHLESPLLHVVEDLGHGLDPPRLLDHRRDVLGAPPELLPHVEQNGLGHRPVLEVGELPEVRLGESCHVVLGVEALPDPVQSREGPEDEGEGRREDERPLLPHREKLGPNLGAPRLSDGELLLGRELVLPHGVLVLERLLELLEEGPRHDLDRGPVHVLPKDPHLLRAVHHRFGVVLVHAEGEEDEALPDVLGDVVHHPKVVVDEPAARVGRVARHVTRVRVAVEEAVPAQLRHVRVRRTLRQHLSVDPGSFDGVDVRDLDAGHVLHRDHLLGHVSPLHFGHLDPGLAGKVGPELVAVPRLGLVVDLPVEEPRVLRVHPEPVPLRPVQLGVHQVCHRG
mmetsp:Transcript_3912/g.9282  ORF Transcript_3912/g.9282 Transcript_3912/m.9282 type:complete len:450 (+) Transcript_3912:264-1613(+)